MAVDATTGQVTHDFVNGPALPEPNYAVALAGAFTALEALNRARSIGKFYHPNPVHEKMAELEKDIQKLIHLTIVEGTKVGQTF